MRHAPSLLGIFCSLGLTACEAAKEGYQSSFKQSFEKSFGESCTQGAVAEGAAEEKVKPLCECAARYLVTHHGTAELMKLGLKAESPEAQQMTGAAIDSCSATAP
jgi:hypothetical protein